jgi:uncharacterized protein involved in response to NO
MMMAPTPRLRDYAGPAILSCGFRPFFLLGSLHAGLAVLAWLPMFYGELGFAILLSPRDWHIHEMLYGYLPAVVTPQSPTGQDDCPCRASHCLCLSSPGASADWP